MRNLLIPISALGLISLVLSGCASTKDAVLPQDGPPMKAIYEQHIQEMGAHDPLVVREVLGNRPVVDGEGALHGYTREAYNEIDTTFPRVPNPSLVMYVFPHLAGNEQVPVPGYVTTFPMYERVEYALPGEVPTNRQPQ
jgi:conjugative transfer region lipoprotein (TIGR03751 family)